MTVDPEEYPAVCQALSLLADALSDARGEALMIVSLRDAGQDEEGRTVTHTEVASSGLGGPDAALLIVAAAMTAVAASFAHDVTKGATPDRLSRLAKVKAALDALTLAGAPGDTEITIEPLGRKHLQ